MPSNLTTEKLARLKELEADATPGPWRWEGRRVGEDGWVSIPQGSYLGETLIMLSDTYEGSNKDCDLITESRNALPHLIAIAEAVLCHYRLMCEDEAHRDLEDCSICNGLVGNVARDAGLLEKS